jgi:hypothetical protein
MQFPLFLLRVFGEVDVKRAICVWAGTRVGLVQEEGHLLVYAVVFGVDEGGGQLLVLRGGGRGRGAHGGGVHVCDKVAVVGLLRPEVGAGIGVLWRGRVVVIGAPVGEDAEDGVGEGCGSAQDGAGCGGGAPLVRMGGEEVVGDGEEAEGGGSEGWSVAEVSIALEYFEVFLRTERRIRLGSACCDRRSRGAQ